MSVDAANLLAAISRSVDALAFTRGELDARLAELVETVAQVFGFLGAGIMMMNESGQLYLIGTFDPTAGALELAQREGGVGPGVQATRLNRVVAVDDLNRDERWPQLRETLVPRGVRSLLCAPIRVHNRPVGNLNLVDGAPREWTQSERAGLTAYAGLIGAMLRIALDGAHEDQLVLELAKRLATDAADDS